MRMTSSPGLASVLACVLALTLTLASAPALAGQLAGSEWRPTQIGDLEIAEDTEMFVRFGGEGTLQGHGGCNGFFGTYKLAGDEIEIGPLGATRMACAEPGVEEREARFLEALQNAKRFARERIDLTLSDAAGQTLAQLIQTDAD